MIFQVYVHSYFETQEQEKEKNLTPIWSLFYLVQFFEISTKYLFNEKFFCHFSPSFR